MSRASRSRSVHVTAVRRRTAERSNLYSESRFTNWLDFDPFEGEINAMTRGLRPVLRVATGPAGASCAVYERPLHPAFVRPCSAAEVADVLASIPPRYLRGLGGVYLLGGTWKQERTAFSGLFRFGCYGAGRVYLHALPRRLLRQSYPGHPHPTVVQSYARAGARFEQRAGGTCTCVFDTDALRRFYLYDVLPHEVGHHADRHNLDRTERRAERFADWFARTTGEQVRRQRRNLDVAPAERPATPETV